MTYTHDHFRRALASEIEAAGGAIRVWRVSSAQARGYAGKFSYYGVVPYSLRNGKKGPALRAEGRAKSERRSLRLATRDAIRCAGEDGIVSVMGPIGTLSEVSALWFYHQLPQHRSEWPGYCRHVMTATGGIVYAGKRPIDCDDMRIVDHLRMDDIGVWVTTRRGTQGSVLTVGARLGTKDAEVRMMEIKDYNDRWIEQAIECCLPDDMRHMAYLIMTRYVYGRWKKFA